jgi:carbonic anhydrase/acetyltransferase-like protein (isoleucine patch superfamily)
MNSTILNRAKIGNNCLVGANSLISEGKEFPDGSMILGAPGRVAKELSEQQHAMLNFSAQGYVRNFQRHRSELKQIG